MRAILCDSATIRPARRTTSSSSVSPSRVSASTEIAPTGVLSSWLTFATKSVRTWSTRNRSVMSSTVASAPPSRNGAARTMTTVGGGPASCTCSTEAFPSSASLSCLSTEAFSSTSACRVPVNAAAAALRAMSVPSRSITTTPSGMASRTRPRSGASTAAGAAGTCTGGGATTCAGRGRLFRTKTSTARPTSTPARNSPMPSPSGQFAGGRFISPVSSLRFLKRAAPLCSGIQPSTR